MQHAYISLINHHPFGYMYSGIGMFVLHGFDLAPKIQLAVSKYVIIAHMLVENGTVVYLLNLNSFEVHACRCPVGCNVDSDFLSTLS